MALIQHENRTQTQFRLLESFQNVHQVLNFQKKFIVTFAVGLLLNIVLQVAMICGILWGWKG